MTIKDIERQIKKLPRPRLAAFRAWFHRFDAETWDRQIDRDIHAGKLEKIAAKALSSHKAGRTKEM